MAQPLLLNVDTMMFQQNLMLAKYSYSFHPDDGTRWKVKGLPVDIQNEPFDYFFFNFLILLLTQRKSYIYIAVSINLDF